MRALKNISLIFLFCIVVGLADKTKSQELIAPKEQNQTITTRFDTNKLADAIADRFISAMQNRNYSFLVKDKLESLRKEIYDFAAKYPPTQMSPAEQGVLLASVDRYVSDYFLNRGFDFPGDFPRDFDMEGAYLKFQDQINTFKWKLWLAITRKPPSMEQLKQRQVQHDWLRKFIANVPIRPGDWRPVDVSPDDIRKWASAHLEQELADPLSLLYDPMTHSQFEVFKQWMKRSAANGLSNTVTNIPVRAIGARAHNHADVEKAYSYPFDIELPFKDEVRSVWGGGGGAGTHLVFASNVQFRGRDVFLDSHGYRQVFDIVQGILRLPPEVRDGATDKSIADWTKKQNKGDIDYNDMTASLLALRSAKIAELKVANWFEADRVSNAELHKLITEYGRTSISVKQLPPMNGFRRVGVSEPRFFIVVRSRERRLAVIDLRNREFGQINFVGRLRSMDSTVNTLTIKTRSATDGVGSSAPPN
ncbi:MAG: hypothetical protein IIC00_04520 [Planctomycetes bacterium]|nr:hypothetical protein [Planctomycetota bacterium]